MINFLRHGGNYQPKFETRDEENLFAKTLEFWGIKPSHGFGGVHQEENTLTDTLPQRLVALIQSEPQGLTNNALYRWRELGPLKFGEIQAKSFEKIDFNMRFGTSSNNPEIKGQIDVDEYGIQEYV